MLITLLVIKFQPKGHWEPRIEVRSWTNYLPTQSQSHQATLPNRREEWFPLYRPVTKIAHADKFQLNSSLVADKNIFRQKCLNEKLCLDEPYSNL